MTEAELKEHVEDITRNNTCQRPDISHYDTCEPCPFKKYCLCRLNTYKNGGRVMSRLRYRRRKK